MQLQFNYVFENLVKIFLFLLDGRIFPWQIWSNWFLFLDNQTFSLIFSDDDESRWDCIECVRVTVGKHYTQGLLTQHHFCVSDLIMEKSFGLLSGSNLRVRAIRLSVNTPKTRSTRLCRSIVKGTKRTSQQTKQRHWAALGMSSNYQPNYPQAGGERPYQRALRDRDH